MANITSRPIDPASGLASPRRDWVVVGAILALGICAFGLTFRPEIETAIYVWINSDAYNHCFLVLPVAAYLAWDRRQAVMATTLRPAIGLALLAIPAAAVWFAADRLGIMEGRQLMAMTLFQIMVASLFGVGIWRALAAPLLYLFFLVPFGEFVVPSLQGLVVHFTTTALDLLKIPNLSDGVVIEIPEGTFIVHQACSGLRFLVASVAFGVLYACVIYTSLIRRVLFIVLSLGVAILGNCFRVIGIILIAHFIGDAQAVQTGHVLWGWLFYLIIGAVLILIGLAFRQEGRSVVPTPPLTAAHNTGVTFAVFMFILVATVVPVLAANYLDQLGTETAIAADISMPAPRGCVAAPLPAQPVQKLLDAGSRSLAYQCDNGIFVLTLGRYPPRIGVRPLFSSLTAAAKPPGWDIIFETTELRPSDGPATLVWRVTEGSTEHGYVALALALWLDGRPTGAGIAARLKQALNAVRRSPLPPVLAVVTHFGGDSPNDARRAIDSFLPRIEPLAGVLSAWLSTQRE